MEWPHISRSCAIAQFAPRVYHHTCPVPLHKSQLEECFPGLYQGASHWSWDSSLLPRREVDPFHA